MLPRQVFVSISDPRRAWQVRRDLSELLTVAVCAVLCGADEFSDIEAWANKRIDWLRGFSGALARHPLARHVWTRLCRAQSARVRSCVRRWVGQWIPVLGEDAVVAIDGKTSRSSTTKAARQVLCIWSAPSPPTSASCSVRSPRPRSPVRSRRFPNCWRRWRLRAVSSPSTLWAPRPALRRPFVNAAPTTCCA